MFSTMSFNYYSSHTNGTSWGVSSSTTFFQYEPMDVSEEMDWEDDMGVETMDTSEEMDWELY